MQERACLECGTAFRGRADKKFCSDGCRNAYNNKQNSDSTNYVRNVNNMLRKNRRILAELNPKGKSITSKDELLKRGFSFSYFTNTYKTKAGLTYYFCYEYGYLEIERKQYALVMRQEYVQ